MNSDREMSPRPAKRRKLTEELVHSGSANPDPSTRESERSKRMVSPLSMNSFHNQNERVVKLINDDVVETSDVEERLALDEIESVSSMTNSMQRTSNDSHGPETLFTSIVDGAGHNDAPKSPESSFRFTSPTTPHAFTSSLAESPPVSSDVASMLGDTGGNKISNIRPFLGVEDVQPIAPEEKSDGLIGDTDIGALQHDSSHPQEEWHHEATDLATFLRFDELPSSSLPLHAATSRSQSNHPLLNHIPTSNNRTMIPSTSDTPRGHGLSAPRREQSQRSPSLSTPPPSPPRRRTRETNKLFAPYTAYKRQWGDAELRRLEALETRKRVQRHGDDHEQTVEDDPAWMESQSQREDESQVLWSQPFHHTGRHKDVMASTAAREHRLNHNMSRQGRRHAATTESHQSSHNRSQSRSMDGVRLIQDRVRPKQSMPQALPQPRASVAMITEVLQKLYGDDSGSDTGSSGQNLLKSSSRHHVDDIQLSEGTAHDPESSEAVEENPSDEELQRSNEHQEQSKIGSTDDDEHQSDERSGSDAESEDEMDRRRQRILSRVWPAVMIKKKAEEARKKELEIQRKRSEEERSRRQVLGLGDSDASDDTDRSRPLAPGQSRRVKFVDENPPMSAALRSESRSPSLQSGEGPPPVDVIDLTSDIESLDNDDDLDDNVATLVSDDDSEPVDRHHGVSLTRRPPNYGPDSEAIEDNRLHRGGTRISVHIRDIKKSRRKQSDAWMFQDGRVKPRQTRIDHILNASRTAHSSKGGRSRGNLPNGKRNPRSHRATTRPPASGEISARREKRHRQVQSKLPFDRVGADSDNSSEASFELRKKNHHKPKLRPSTGVLVKKTTKGTFGGVTVSLRSEMDRPLELFNILTRPEAQAATSSGPGKQASRPLQNSTKHLTPISNVSTSRQPMELIGGRRDFEDPDSHVDISLHSALAFGMRRSREGFRLPEESWISRGRILDLINLLSGETPPTQPYPCHMAGTRLDADLPISDFQLHIPTICDLLFEATVESSRKDDSGSTLDDLMRFICLYVSWSVTRIEDDTDRILSYIRSQLSLLMERVEEYCRLRGMSGRDFNQRLFKIHWFAIELSNRIAIALITVKGERMEEVVLKDTTSDQFSVSLMARLLEFGVRRTAAAFSNTLSPSALQTYTLELWVALIHITLLRPVDSEAHKSASSAFWRMMMDALGQSNRHFPSVIHEAEFIFSMTFSLSSISCINPLGVGQNERLLQAYWPIVCRSLVILNLSPEVDEYRKPSQATLAAKDTYLGMLFARCNVLAFRWDWSLQDNAGFKQLVEILRETLKNRKFMNLIHEQSEFPRFITQRNLDLLRQFDAKDSIQTILIKLIFRKVEDGQENKQTARKWVSLLASTTILGFTKEKPPTQKELSALFNQFTIKFILLHINPEPNNVRALINGSKRIVDFQTADHRSRQICIRAAMIFGRFCRHYHLPIQDVSGWISEMAYILLAEYSTVRRDGTSYQLKEITIMCAVIVASLRDVLLSRAMDNAQTPLPPLFPDPSVCMIDVIAKLLSASRELNECVSEVGNLIKCILDLRTHFFPDPPIPQFPSQVLEEESQEDYGFDPIDINDPDLVEAMMVGQEGQVKPYWDEDFALAKAFCDLTTSITSVISRIAYLDKGSRKRKDTELWTEAWANIAILCTAHNLKQWDYFLRRTPRSLGRLDDLTWRQESEPMFLLHVLSGDPKSYYADREVFSRCWFLSMALDPQHSIPSYTFTLFHVDGLKSPIWEGIQFPRGMSEEDFEEVFVEQRLYLIQGVLHNLEGHYHASKDGANASVALVTEGVDGLLEMLTLMRYNVMEKAKAGNDNSLREYFEYCCEVVKILRDLDIGRDSRLSPLLADAWIDRASAWLRGE